MDAREKVGASALAEVLGLKSTRINELVANGVLHPEGKPRKYVLKEAVQDYIAYLKGLNDPSKDEEKALDKKKLKAEAALKAAKAAEAQIELAELSGNMHSAEDVQAAFEQLVYGMRSMLLALPGRVAVDVIGAANTADAAEIIRAQVNDVLNALSEYEYDPEFFSERVRDRKGWIGTVDKLSGSEGERPQPHDKKRR